VSEPLVTARGLRVGVPAVDGNGHDWPVDGVDLIIPPRSSIALVGASGSGKSLTARALLGLAPPGGTVRAAELTVAGVAVLDASDETRRRLRGGTLGLLAQDADAALNPVLRIAEHFRESAVAHGGPKGWRDHAADLLATVDLEPEAALRAYPHQLSGGQRRRATLALALAPGPACLIADEPTSGLDVLSRAKVLDTLDEAIARDRRSLVHITHDLAVAADRTGTVAIMVHGEIVELGPTAATLGRPRHPFTRRLVAAARADAPDSTLPSRRHVSGCRFAASCPDVDARCRAEVPAWIGDAEAGVRCHRIEEAGS
jgi:ABC-type dipeptide/oligopeptide/nickel transport system ATPase component